jgi:hypothetical protein
MSLYRRRATRTSPAVQSRYGCAVHLVTGILHCRLFDGRFRGGPIQKGLLGVDFLLVGCPRTLGLCNVILLTQLIVLDPQQKARIDRSQMARERIADFHIMNINFYPRESRLITFRDPWSFPMLFHPACNNLIRGHLEVLAQKVKDVLRMH